jgi:hypothetical protein
MVKDAISIPMTVLAYYNAYRAFRFGVATFSKIVEITRGKKKT